VPRFVILRHQTQQGEHFDCMLELGGVLKTWSLPRRPELGVEISGEALPDHRIEYLDYEGPISGDRGAVSRWEYGTYTPDLCTDTEWIVQLIGEQLAARARLVRSEDDPRHWQITFT
jgi:hypothetical protein